ncbi:AAA family ATPase [Trichocoleus desertorum GB2-A4]|uniref:AAA family ATPase n=2 Tax=Trichocoleusaceae TaxID=2303527 RepID=A0ABV0J349_9CYAN
MESFRGIDEMTLEFSDSEPIVLIGVNGVGKSSILDCLSILLSWLTTRIEYDPDGRGSFARKQDGHLVIARQSELAEGHNFDEFDVKNGERVSRGEVTLSFGIQKVTWALTKTLVGRSTANTHVSLSDLDRFTGEKRRQCEEDLEASVPLAIYYSVNRAVLEVSLEVLQTNWFDQTSAYENALTGAHSSFGSFFQWFRFMEDLENETRRDDANYQKDELKAVRQAIYSILGEGFSDLRIRRSPLHMTVKKYGQDLSINQLSDGEKCLLAMVGDLARRLAIANPGLADPLQGEGVVLIDEIELHLHPAWQREVIPALTRTFPNCQFIVTTHSPQVVSQVKPEGIYLLERTPQGVIARHPESSYGRDSNRILEDVMGVPERPQTIKDSLRRLFRLIEEGNLDSARQLQHQLEQQIGDDEPEFARADVLIRRKEILGR